MTHLSYTATEETSSRGAAFGTGFQEKNQVGIDPPGEIDRIDLCAELGVGVPDVDVPLDNLCQRFQAAVLHVGCCQGHIANRWRLENPSVVCRVCDDAPPKMGIRGSHADTRVVVFVVDQVGADMAGGTADFFAEKELASEFGTFGNGVCLAGFKAGDIHVIEIGIALPGELHAAQRLVVIVG